MPEGGLSGTLLMKIPSNWWLGSARRNPILLWKVSAIGFLSSIKPSERTELMLLFFSVSTLVQDLVKGQH